MLRPATAASKAAGHLGGIVTEEAPHQPVSIGVSPKAPPGSAPVVARPALAPQASGVLGKDRSPASVLGLSIITLGVYYLVWYGSINAEIKRHNPSIRVSPGWSVVAAIFPVFNVVSAYSTAARIRQMQLDCGQTQTISPVVALLLFLFLGIGFPLYIASQLHEHWHVHARVGGRLLPNAETA